MVFGGCKHDWQPKPFLRKVKQHAEMRHPPPPPQICLLYIPVHIVASIFFFLHDDAQVFYKQYFHS